MADDPEAKAKAEKIAAARKRVEQLKKKKGPTKPGKKDKKDEQQQHQQGEAAAEAGAESSQAQDAATAAEDEKAALGSPTTEETPEKQEEAEPTESQPRLELEPEPEQLESSDTVPSLAQKSKMRSASFRKASISGPLSPGLVASLGSPEGETAPDIYRKHVGRIEELERENKRLAREAADAEKRWQKAEEDLADLREGDSGGGKKSGGLAEKLKNEITSLERQNAQLQAQISRSNTTRHGSSPSISMVSPPATSELEAQLQSKRNTIESMEIEMSRLRAQVERLTTGDQGAGQSPEQEQIIALEEKLSRAERAGSQAQRELTDLKRNLDRTAEKAVKEGSERASAETKLRTLAREAAEATEARDELARRAEALEKKVATLTTLHKEQDARTQALRREKERADKELAETRERVERVEAENLRLRKHDARERGGTDDDGVDELENEGLARLERRIRNLEAENHDLRRGIWHERRKELQVGPDEDATAGAVSPSGRFSDIDLGGSGISSSARRGHGGSSGAVAGLGDFFQNSLNALAGVEPIPSHQHAHHHDQDGFLDDDDEMEFDEEAFRRAQEEEARKRVERIKEIKRTLKNWEGWRLDLVENRGGGGRGEGAGEIFEI